LFFGCLHSAFQPDLPFFAVSCFSIPCQVASFHSRTIRPPRTTPPYAQGAVGSRYASAYFSFSICMHITHGSIKSPCFYSILPGSFLVGFKRPSLDSDLIFAASNQNACHISFKSTWHPIPWQLAAGKPMLFGVAKKEAPASGEKPRGLWRSMARLVTSHYTCERCFQHAR
jgi:hypothetical protein